MRLVTGLDCLDTPTLFAASKRRIILHAAVYGPLANSQRHYRALCTAVEKHGFERLDIIAVDPDRMPAWSEPFFKALRFGVSRQDRDAELTTSHDFLVSMAEEYPDKITLHHVRALPCLPIIVADNTILFGHYAHAEIQAPLGYWGRIEADVPKLLEWAENGSPAAQATNSELAAFRLVSECFRAMNDTPYPRDHGTSEPG